jgi:hypothetical protein
MVSSACAINDRGQGKRPKRLMLGSSMAMITMSSGAGSKPRCLINQSRALVSRPGTRQTINKARVADSSAIATAQTAPLSLDKITGFPFRLVVSIAHASKKNARLDTETQRQTERVFSPFFFSVSLFLCGYAGGLQPIFSPYLTIVSMPLPEYSMMSSSIFAAPGFSNKITVEPPNSKYPFSSPLAKRPPSG